LRLAAWINGVEVASTTTQASGTAVYYLLDIPPRAYDPITRQVCRQGGASGETIYFVLCDAFTANETAIWNGGSLVQRNLTVARLCSGATNTPMPTSTPTATPQPRLYLPMIVRR